VPDDRDSYRPKHRTPVSGVAVEVHEETSEAHDIGGDRDRFRARRGTDARVLRLEHRVDEQSETIAQMRADLGEVKGGVLTLVRLETERAEARRSTEAREIEAARDEREAVREGARRRSAIVRVVVLKVIAPLAAALAAVLAAYKAGGG